MVHPSLKKEAYEYLDDRIIKLSGVNYEDMVDIIMTSKGIITDSGGDDFVSYGQMGQGTKELDIKPIDVIGMKQLENINSYIINSKFICK